MQRYFSNKLENNKFELNNDDIYHITRVMRMKTGDNIEVEVKGEVPKEGSTITIEEGKIIDINLLYGDITIIKDENRNLVYSNVEGGNEAGGQKVTITPKKETYTVGDEVTIGKESFYVIADDANKVILLTKDRIDVENLVQSANANNIAFSSTNYWSTETNIEGLDLNKYPIPEGVTSVITTAKEYGAKVGGTGRLIAYEEATTLQTVDSDILYGTNGKSSGSSFNYWMGIAHASDKVKIVLGEEGGMLLYYDFNSPISVGVRPVVEISKANLS